MATPKLGDFWHDWVGTLPPQEMGASGGGYGGASEEAPRTPGEAEFYRLAENNPNAAATLATLSPAAGVATSLLGQSPQDIQNAAGVIADTAAKERTASNPDAFTPAAPLVPVSQPAPTAQESLALGLEQPVFKLPAQNVTAKELRELASEQKKAADEEAQLIAMQAQRKGELEQLQAEKEAEAERARLDREAAQAAGEANYRDTYRKTASELDAVPAINPDRYWQNKNGFQKGMSALAGFLFGLSGKGMDYLHLIEQEIDRDVSAQKFDYENKRQSIKERMGGIQNEYQMFRDSGLNARQSELSAKIQRGEQFKKQLGILEASSGSYISKANARVANFKIDEALQKNLADLDVENRNRAAMDYNARASIFQSSLKASMPVALSDTQQKEVASGMSGLEKLDRMEELATALGKNAPERLISNVMAKFNIGNKAELLTAYENLRLAAAKDLLGVLRKDDEETINRMQPGGVGFQDAAATIRLLKKSAAGELGSRLKVYKSGGNIGTIERQLKGYEGLPSEVAK